MTVDDRAQGSCFTSVCSNVHAGGAKPMTSGKLVHEHLHFGLKTVKPEGKPSMSPTLQADSCIPHKDELPMQLSLTFPLCTAEASQVTFCWMLILNLGGKHHVDDRLCLGSKAQICVRTLVPVMGFGYPSWDLTAMLF